MRTTLLIIISLSTMLNANFTRNSTTSIIIDSDKKLEWQDSRIGDLVTWESAITMCETLSLGGHDDWQLPNINELKTIIDRNKVDPAIDNSFINIGDGNYWSSTSVKDDEYNAWVVDFRDGNLNDTSKSSENYVRCVRDGN